VSQQEYEAIQATWNASQGTAQSEVGMRFGTIQMESYKDAKKMNNRLAFDDNGLVTCNLSGNIFYSKFLTLCL